MPIMNKLRVLIFCAVLAGCGSYSVPRPVIEMNAENHIELALQAYKNEQWQQAEQLFNRALLNYQSLDERVGVLLCHINLVEVALSRQQLAKADKNLSQAIAIIKAEVWNEYQSRIALLQARLAIKQINLTVAKQLLKPLIPHFQGSQSIAAIDAIRLAAVASRTEIAFSENHQTELWTLRFLNALSLSKTHNDTMKARLFRFQAALKLGQKQYQNAETLLLSALTVYKGNALRSGIAAVLSELGQLYQQQNRFKKALDYYARAETVLRSLGYDKKVKSLKLKQAELKRNN